MQNERFKSTMAVIVAIVTVLGAMAACMATVASSNAGDGDFTGLETAIRAQKAESINHIYAYQHYRAFSDYSRYLELGNLMYDPNADEKTSIANGTIQREVWGIASGISSIFFEPRYISPDGTYDIQRELDEALAEDSQNADLNPAPYFEESDHQRRRSSSLTADMIVFAVSFWFLTLAQVTDRKIKYVWAVLGIMLGIAGILGMLIARYVI
jgi:hypothetical protein